MKSDGWDLIAESDAIMIAIAFVEAVENPDKIHESEDLVRHYAYEV